LVSFESSLLTGVEASFGENLPVTKPCSRCGSVLPSSAGACHFCDSSFSVGFSAMEESLAIPVQNVSAGNTDGIASGIAKPVIGSPTLHRTTQYSAWRVELSQRFRGYRPRRRQLSGRASP